MDISFSRGSQIKWRYIRLCVDMRHANRAVLRERHTIPTVDEVLHDLNGSQVFTKLYINSLISKSS